MDDLTRLAGAARDGDEAALADFVVRTQAEVWRLCASLGDRADADDLTQETYLRAVPALRRFRAQSSARTWLLTIARRVCADHVRSSVRRRDLVRRAPRAGVQVDPAGVVSLAQLVDQLDDDQRDAFVLTQQLGCSYDEAAAILDCPVGTIRSRVSRARGHLVDALAADTEPGQAASGAS